MKRIYSIVVVIMLPWLAFAQQPQGESFTLEQCIQYALENSINIKNVTIDEKIAEARVKETVGLGLPQVSASAGIQHNQKLRRFFTQYNPNGGFIDLSSVPGIQSGDVVAAQNFFQLKSSGDAGVTVNQLIFNGSYLVGLQAASAYKDFAHKNLAVTKEQVIQGVTKAYYSVLINRERTKLFNTNISRLDTLLRNTKALFQNGFVESIDVDRVQVQYNNLVTERDNFIHLNGFILDALKFQMNYPMNQPIDVAGSINDVMIETGSGSYGEGFDYKNRSDFIVLEANHRLQSLNIRNQYATALPSVVAFANLGYASQSPNVGGLFKTNSSISEAGGVGPDKWYGYSLFGISLNWNLFTGMSRHYKIQQEKLTLQKIENGFQALKSGIDLETKQTSVAYDNALKMLAVQKQNMELAANVARVTKIKYEQGVGSNLEVTNAEGDLKGSQLNYYSALFDAMVAKVDLDKAYGRLKPPVTENK
jgi:outer membrane protein